MTDLDDFYHYSSLSPSGEDDIRIIHLQPSSDLESIIQCSLKNATLTEYRDDIADHYVALSYVWGDANDKRCIMVDGKRLDITASLDSALRHIRDARRVLRVWADGVCINQNDAADRNRQVRLMGEIYSIAEHTIIFLGVSSPQCEFALKRIKALLSKSQMKSTNDPITGKHIESIIEDDILAHAWFTRVWIFQELLLSKDPWLQCGVTRIRWEIFCNYILFSVSVLWKPESRIVLENMNKSRINLKMPSETGVDNSDEASNAIPDTSLLTYMSTRRGYGVSDPRDMVYAHVGLTPTKTRHTISIDYDKTVAQTYEDIALFYMEAIGVLPMLLFVEKVQPEQRRRSLPSWVPDWASPLQLAGTNRPYVFENLVQFDFEFYSVSAYPQILAVAGYDFGSIDVTIPRSSWPADVNVPASSTTITSVMEWMARTDDEFLRTKQLFVDFCVEMAIHQTDYDPLFRDFDNSYEAARAYIDFSQWMPSNLRNSLSMKDFFWSPADWNQTESYFGKIFFNTLVALTSCYSQSKHVAALRGGMLVQLPTLARAGDLIMRARESPEKADWTVARSCEAGLSYDRELLLRDLEYFEPIRTTNYYRLHPDLDLPRIHSCNLVASVLDPWDDLFKPHDLVVLYRSFVASKKGWKDAAIYAFH